MGSRVMSDIPPPFPLGMTNILILVICLFDYIDLRHTYNEMCVFVGALLYHQDIHAF